jgi:hypothetical protein
MPNIRKIVIKPTASGRKWIARVGDREVCESTSPFVKSARLLLDEGYSADAVIEMWRPNTDEWALRGRLGSVAATVMDGETASHCAKNGAPSRDPEQDGQRTAAGLRSSSDGSWRLEASEGEAGEAAQRTMSQKRLGHSAGDAEAMKIATPCGRWGAGAVRS